MLTTFENLALSSMLRTEMGARMREKIVAQFSDGIVVRQTLKCHAKVLETIDDDLLSARIQDPDC